MSDIEEIKKRLNLVELVGQHVPLKKSGRNYKGNCPFHQEKTASFVVAEDKQIWHCFGCGKGGDHYTFLMELEGLEFREAAEQLAEKAGVKLQISEADIKSGQVKKRLKQINKITAEFYHLYLLGQDKAAPALEYLKKRGLTDETIAEFKLGYAPITSTLLDQLQKKGFTPTELIDAGIALQDGTKFKPRFHSRITFPLIDANGDVVGFTARVLDNSLPKYINSPETKIYHKSNFIYGLFQAKNIIRAAKHTIVVEGQMDVIASYQAGIRETVASSGTAISADQLKLLKRYTDQVILALDVDKAGRDATKRAIELASQTDLTLKVASIPAGKDPADAIASDRASYETAIRQAEPFLDYLLRKAGEDHGTKTAEAKKLIAKEVLPFIAGLDVVERAHYVTELSHKLSVPEDSLYQALKRHGGPVAKKPEIVPASTKSQPLIWHLAALLLAFPQLIEKASAQSVATSELATKVIDATKSKTLEQVFDREELNQLKAMSIELEESHNLNAEQNLRTTLERLKLADLHEQKQELVRLMGLAAGDDDLIKQDELIKQFEKLLVAEQAILSSSDDSNIKVV